MVETPFPPQILAAAELAGRLHSGSAALFPTDTVPALAARPEAAAQLWQLKRRPARKPMILMGADAEALFAALEVPIAPQWRAMAERCWPGPCMAKAQAWVCASRPAPSPWSCCAAAAPWPPLAPTALANLLAARRPRRRPCSRCSRCWARFPGPRAAVNPARCWPGRRLPKTGLGRWPVLAPLAVGRSCGLVL